MKLHRRLFARVLFLLLSPMAAHATLITYTSNDLGGGVYMTAEVDITSTTPGQLYSETNGGLTSFTLSAFNAGGSLLGSASAPPSTTFDNYVLLGAGGDITEWFLWARSSPTDFMYTLNHTDDNNGGCCARQSDSVTNNSPATNVISHNTAGTWSDVPEPGTLALLAAGIGGFMYRRKTIANRI